MTKDRLLLLLTAYLEDNLQPEDYQVLVDYFHETGHETDIAEAITAIVRELDLGKNIDVPSDEIYQNITGDQRFTHVAEIRNVEKKDRKPKGLTWFFAAAAVGLILLLFGKDLLQGVYKDQHARQASGAMSNAIVPGGKKAILTLSDGTQLDLDSNAKDMIAIQGNMHVNVEQGKLAYIPSKDNKGEDHLLMNTIATPIGGEYQVLLPDGTKVWLNSASSITYSLAFNGKERKLTMKGEAYFEVASDKRRPFIVEVEGVQVDVLGTHFNINAYPEDKSVKTTLVEGAVQIKKDSGRYLLKPGQQVKVNLPNGKIETVAIDLEEVLAWKNGDFFFNSEPLESVMKKISRWYDVDIDYQGNFEGKRLDGTISRSEDIRQLLAGFEETKIARFSIIGRRVIVMN